MSFHYYYNYFFLAVFIATSGDIMSVDYSYFYCKEADLFYEYIVVESSPYCVCCVYLS